MRRVAFAGILALVASSCGSARYAASGTGGPSVVVPVAFAEGHQENHEADAGPAPPAPEESPSAAGLVSGAPPAEGGALPDPAPLVTSQKWEFTFRYDRGALTVAAVKAVHLRRPTPTARRVGRFAVELRVGKELVDRVRFDFPLLADEAPPSGSRRPLHDAPLFGPGVQTTQRVEVPDSDRATSAVLVDRLTREVFPLEWPPVAKARSGE